MANRKMPFGIHANRMRYTGILSRNENGKSKVTEFHGFSANDALSHADGFAKYKNYSDYSTSYYKNPMKKYKRIK